MPPAGLHSLEAALVRRVQRVFATRQSSTRVVQVTALILLTLCALALLTDWEIFHCTPVPSIIDNLSVLNEHAQLLHLSVRPRHPLFVAANIIQPTAAPRDVPIALATHLSVDRLPSFLRLARELTRVLSSLLQEHEWLSSLLFLHVVSPFEVEGDSLETLRLVDGHTWDEAWLSPSSEDVFLYPINYLRNAATQYALHDVVILLDVDNTPSFSARGLQALWDTFGVSSEALKTGVFVLNNFEVDADHAHKLKTTCTDASDASTALRCQDELAELTSQGHARISHSDDWPPAYGPSDVDRWWKTGMKLYEVNYELWYEPYCIVDRRYVPEYDELLVYTAMDAAGHMLEMYTKGFKFHVLPVAFVWQQRQSHEKRRYWATKHYVECDSILYWNIFFLPRLRERDLADQPRDSPAHQVLDSAKLFSFDGACERRQRWSHAQRVASLRT